MTQVDLIESTHAINLNFRRHSKTVHGKIMALACDECDYTTNDNGNFRAHVKAVHNKKRDLKCEHCDFTASHRYELNKIN